MSQAYQDYCHANYGPEDIPGPEPVRATVTLFVPDGYKDADDFLKDCQFERAEISAGDLFNQLLTHINFDGMDPRTFSLAEIHDAIPGAEWPK